MSADTYCTATRVAWHLVNPARVGFRDGLSNGAVIDEHLRAWKGAEQHEAQVEAQVEPRNPTCVSSPCTVAVVGWARGAAHDGQESLSLTTVMTDRFADCLELQLPRHVRGVCHTCWSAIINVQVRVWGWRQGYRSGLNRANLVDAAALHERLFPALAAGRCDGGRAKVFGDRRRREAH